MKIEKIGDNDWEITPVKRIKDIKGKSVEIYDEDKKFTIGKKGVQRHIEGCQFMIDFYNDPQKVAEAKAQKEQEKSDWEEILNQLNE